VSAGPEGAAHDHPALPLARLFGLAGRALVDGLHERLQARGWHDVRPAYGYVLLACRDGQPTSSELAELLGVSKQAAAKLVEAMVLADLLRRVASAGDARAKPLRLTRRGRRLLEVVEAIYVELEAEWADVIGRPMLETVRVALGRVLAAVYGQSLPPVRPI
jgi:DNA-binding MarR family transcriptional regulator